MQNREAYISAIRLNDKLLEFYKSIQHDLSKHEVQLLATALSGLAAETETSLKSAAALTTDRDESLSHVHGETASVVESAKLGRATDAWAALSRAHGHINRVFVSVMHNMG